MGRTYVILDADEVVNINFDDVVEDSADTLRFSLDGDKTLVKFEGDTPDFLVGKTTNTFNHSEILVELAKPEWTPPTPE